MAYYVVNSNGHLSCGGRTVNRIALQANDTSESSNASNSDDFQIDDVIVDDVSDRNFDCNVVDDAISRANTDECSPIGGKPEDGFTYRMDATSAYKTYKQIRYLNSATHMCSELSSYRDNGFGAGGDDCELGKPGNRTGYAGFGAGHCVRSGGDDGGADGYLDTDRVEASSIYMPTLDLDEQSCTSNEELMNTNRQVDAPNCKEMRRKTEAYNKWLSDKIESEKFARRCRIEAEQRQKQAQLRDEEQRRVQREQKIKDWLKKKQLTDAEAERHKQHKYAEMAQLMVSDSSTGDGIGNTATESVKNYNAWLEKKVHTDRTVRTRQRTEADRQKQLVAERKQKARVEYERWMGTVADKPKPVPLNRGLFTLRGSISSMYVNPVPWNDSIDL